MKNLFSTFTVVFLLALFGPFTDAQGNYSSDLQKALLNRTENEKKISSDIYGKIYIYNKSISDGLSNSAAIKAFNNKYYHIDNQNRVFLMIRLNTKNEADGDVIQDKITGLNGEVLSINSGHNGLIEIKCWVPVNEVKKLTNQTLIGSIRAPSPPSFRTVTTDGDIQLKAEDVRTQMNVDGTGYKIGVISTGIKSYDGGLIPSSELPYVQSTGWGNPEDDEGTAMLEIIHDIATGANLYFYGFSEYSDVNTFYTAVNTLGNDCDIIVDDIYFPNEPFFQMQHP